MRRYCSEWTVKRTCAPLFFYTRCDGNIFEGGETALKIPQWCCNGFQGQRRNDVYQVQQSCMQCTANPWSAARSPPGEPKIRKWHATNVTWIACWSGFTSFLRFIQTVRSHEKGCSCVKMHVRLYLLRSLFMRKEGISCLVSPVSWTLNANKVLWVLFENYHKSLT